MILAKATWNEVEALDREQVVIVPVGGIEAGGASLPLGTRTFFVEEVATRVEERYSREVVLAPTLPFGVAGAGAAYAGNVDLGHEAFLATIRSLVLSLARHRFRRFLFLWGGGFSETHSALNLGMRSLKDLQKTLSLAVHTVEPLHAGRAAHQLAAIRPDLVRPAAGPTRCEIEFDKGIEDGFATVIYLNNLRHNIYADADEVGEDPTAVESVPDPEFGRMVFEQQTEHVATLVNVMLGGVVYVRSGPNSNH